MSTSPLLAGLARSPDFLLHDLDLVNRRGLVVQFAEADYRRASFLDHRALRPDTQGAWFPLDLIQDELTDLPPAPAPLWIFHVSHCGSTLLSRLLAELPGNLPLREPLPLLALAMARRELASPVSRLDGAGWQRLAAMVMTLLSRSYGGGQRPLIKATSACANLLAPLVLPATAARALLLHIDLETWLSVMLRDEQVRENGRFYAPAWLGDLMELSGRRDLRLAALSEAEQFTVNWLAAMLQFQRAREQMPERTLQLGFEDFLQEPAAGLTDAARFLGLDASGAEAVVAGPLMRSYAKNPDKPFDAGTRRRELEESRRLKAAEIKTGMTFAAKLCNEIPMLAPLGSRLSPGG